MEKMKVVLRLMEKYEYADPSVSITWFDGAKENGTIEGTKMTLVDEDGYSEIYVKQ